MRRRKERKIILRKKIHLKSHKEKDRLEQGMDDNDDDDDVDDGDERQA
jgi:hypothetical protein